MPGYTSYTLARTETVTVLFTDLVNSTELANRLGHDTYEKFRQEHFTALRYAVAAHNGVEVKTTGDGLMLSFTSSADAVTCAVALQQAASGTEIRIGVSSGEATAEDRDLYGPPVVEAARLCAAAAARQILVSDIVCLLARGKGHTFTSIGELTLKGLPETVPTSEVTWAPIVAGVPLPARLAAAQRIAMVGRDNEQEPLARAWAQAKNGQRQVVFLSGEPGIGKTRLATETVRAAHAEGAVVLLGCCDEDVHFPYQPFVEALRHYVTHASDEVLAAHVREHQGELGRLVPELGRRIPDLPAPQVAEAETERYLLFDAITGLLAAASQQQPLVLLLDDLQWAGAPDLLLLRHILRSPFFAEPSKAAAVPSSSSASPEGGGATPRLLIIGTYRDSDLTRTHPLTAALADWRREVGVERVALRGLDEDAVVAMVAAAAGHRLAEPGLALARALQRETEGSPFFIGEILRHLTESGAIVQDGQRWNFSGNIADLAIPQGVREVIGRRLARMSEDTNKVLSLASVIGRQFDVELLTRISENSEDSVLDALDEATAAALVAEVPGRADTFSFSHALIRTTLYEELSGARRARLHRRVGEALEELTGDEPTPRIDELAHHWLSATQISDAAKAIHYARKAGDNALANLAFEEAAAHYERALGAQEPHDRSGEEMRCDLLLALANAQRRAGSDSYRETVDSAVSLARSLGDGERLASAALANSRPGGFMASAAVVDEQLIALYEEALSALDEGDSLSRARILGQLAAELIYTPERDRRHRLSAEAVAIARRLNDATGLAQVLSLHLVTINDPFTLNERLPLAEELAQLANSVGSSELGFFAAYHRVGVALERCDMIAARTALDQCTTLATHLRQPFYSWWVGNGECCLASVCGDADAEAKAFAALEIGTAGGQPDAASPFGAALVTHLHNKGRNAELVETLRANVESQPHISAWRAALARIYSSTDQHELGRAQLEVLKSAGFDPPLNWVWCGFFAAVSEAATDLDDQEAAAILYEKLKPLSGQVAVLSCMIVCSGSLALYCGMLAACLQLWGDSESHFREALDMNERLGARPYVVRSRRGWAQMLLARAAPGDREQADRLITPALAEAETLGMAREVVLLQRMQAQG